MAHPTHHPAARRAEADTAPRDSHARADVVAYLRFTAMIATSTVVMYLLTYLNSYSWSHVFWSETRAYMALLMGACMAIVMLSFMWSMHRIVAANLAIYAASVAIAALALYLVRSQDTVQDVSYMRAMIPHHSIAILTSERAEIADARVRRLADEIIAAQRREIAEMKVLIEDIEAEGARGAEGPGESATEMLLGPRVPPATAAAAEVADGFRAEVVVTGLTYPTSVEFDDDGTMYVAESGYSYGSPQPVPRILAVSPDGSIAVVAEGDALHAPVNDLLWHDGRLLVSHRGRISALEDGGVVRDLVTGLPSDGDHHNNQMTAGPDGRIYFGQGTATNSGVVGVDNAKMGWLADHPDFHDVPARDVTLTGAVFESTNPLNDDGEQVRTAPFHPYGAPAEQGSVVRGATKASGTVLSMNPDGSDLAVHAWGLRNPYGVMWSADGTLYASENGFDVRGSRPVANDPEDIYVIKEGAWYGWPDYAAGVPVTDPRFKPDGKPQPRFLMADHPSVEQPLLEFPPHAAIAKIDFASAEPFGKGRMFVAFFGHMTPMTGSAPEKHGGHRVLRIDLDGPDGPRVEVFFAKAEDHGGHAEGSTSGHGGSASRDAHANGGESGDKHAGADHGGADEGHAETLTAGPRRLLDVRFGPGGDALYVVDFGAMVVEDKPRPVPGTGVVWRIVPEDSSGHRPPAGVSVAPRP